MKKVEFKINNSKYQIECPQNEEKKVLRLAKKISDRAEKLSKHLNKIDEKTLLATCCLIMEDEIESTNKTQSNQEICDAIDEFDQKIDSLANKIERC